MRDQKDLLRLESLTKEEKTSSEYLERDVDLERLVRVEMMDTSQNKRDTRLSDVFKLCLHFLEPRDVKELIFVNKTFWR